MANITLTMGALTVTKTVSTADLQRIIDTYKANYGQVSGGAGGLRDMTNQELFDAFSAGFFNGLIGAVTSHEGDIAAASARAAIMPIVVS